MFNYYQYADDGAEPPQMQSSAGRAIDPRPLVSLLLEPRSLVITRAALYTGHLHGIEERTEDVLAAASDNDDGPVPDGAVRVANWRAVRAEEARTGGTLVRETRVSLTCRDVERVLAVKRFGR